MVDLVRHPVMQATLLVAALALMTAACIHLVRKWRDGAAHDQPHASQLLTKFRELHARGSLSDEEFRTIKTKLTAQLERELSDSDQTG